MTNHTTLLDYLHGALRQLERDEAAVLAIKDVLFCRGRVNPYGEAFKHMQESYDEFYENALLKQMLEQNDKSRRDTA